jgi:hypothetical protein
MNRFDENTFWKIFALGNLTINVDEQHNLQKQTQNKLGNVRVTNIVVGLYDKCRRGKSVSCTYSEYVCVAYLTSMQSAFGLLYYHVFRISLCHIFST